MIAKRKLIEAAIPLDAINGACKADKDRKTGTIRNLHKWFAPMPSPAWRALLFAALVDDPEDEHERDELLHLVERLMAAGGDVPSPQVLDDARAVVRRSWPQGPPRIADPFCGAGSTLIEAQRLGCETVGSDLNPVPVLITKVLTELLPALVDEPGVTSSTRLDVPPFHLQGLAGDVMHYAELIGERVQERVRESFPSAPDATTLAWLWCRSIRCPNPVCGVETPLATSWLVSRKRGDERWVEPVVADGSVSFRVSGPKGAPPDPPKSGRGSNFLCVACGSPIRDSDVASAGREGKLGLRCTAVAEITADGKRRYRAVTPEEEAAAVSVPAIDSPPSAPLADDPRSIWCYQYGVTTQADLYTARQLLVLDALSDEVARVREDIERDGGSRQWAEAILALLALSVSKVAQANSTQVRWRVRDAAPKAEPAFARPDIPMTWDFAETNPFGGSVGDWAQSVKTALRALPFVPAGRGRVFQADARNASREYDGDVLIATDPPYFDQIIYADLSDYFYVWLRRCLRDVFPDLFATMATPKAGELIALGLRHDNDKQAARRYFIEGFTETFRSAAAAQCEGAPMLVVYAFKEQSRSSNGGIAPGWEAILEAVVAADLMIVGTWPIHGTGPTRMVSMGTNVLATYVVMVCRPRPSEAARITRSELTRLLRAELVPAVAELQHANIAPVDLAQAVIGPGMQVYSRHASVVENDGSRLGVGQALALINGTLGEILDEQEGDLDPDSRWAVTWYHDHGFDTAAFGKADQLARAKGIAVDSLVQAGIVTSGAGKVALISRDRLPAGWDPATDRRATAWEAVQYLIRALHEGGERAAAELYARLGGLSDPARELTYRLFQIAEKERPHRRSGCLQQPRDELVGDRAAG